MSREPEIGRKIDAAVLELHRLLDGQDGWIYLTNEEIDLLEATTKYLEHNVSGRPTPAAGGTS